MEGAFAVTGGSAGRGSLSSLTRARGVVLKSSGKQGTGQIGKGSIAGAAGTVAARNWRRDRGVATSGLSLIHSEAETRPGVFPAEARPRCRDWRSSDPGIVDAGSKE